MEKISKLIIKSLITYASMFMITVIGFVVIAGSGIAYAFISGKSLVFPFECFSIITGNIGNGASGLEFNYSNALLLFLSIIPLIITGIILIISPLLQKKREIE